MVDVYTSSLTCQQLRAERTLLSGQCGNPYNAAQVHRAPLQISGQDSIFATTRQPKDIGAWTESPDLNLKTFPNKYSYHETIPLSHMTTMSEPYMYTYLTDIYAVKEFENIGIGDPEYTLVPSL